MNENYLLAGKGLHTMFVAEIIILVSAFIPLIGIIGILVGLVLSLVGLHTASKTHSGFQAAMTMTLAGIAVSLISIFLPDGGLLGTLISIVSNVLSLAVTYFVCITASDMVEELGQYEVAQRGRFVWKLNLICTVVTVICAVVVFIPILNILAAIAAVVTGIAAIVAGILYLMFLHGASKCLRAG